MLLPALAVKTTAAAKATDEDEEDGWHTSTCIVLLFLVMISRLNEHFVSG